MLLEWRLALELKDRGMLEGVFPLMIGDAGADGKYSNYFKSGCNPNAPDVVVQSVETKLREHLDREGLGMPYKDENSVRSVLTTVLSNQGAFIEGDVIGSLSIAVTSISKMRKRSR